MISKVLQNHCEAIGQDSLRFKTPEIKKDGYRISGRMVSENPPAWEAVRAFVNQEHVWVPVTGWRGHSPYVTVGSSVRVQ